MERYGREDSYFHMDRFQITQALETLKLKDLYIPSPALTNYEAYIKAKLAEENAANKLS